MYAHAECFAKDSRNKTLFVCCLLNINRMSGLSFQKVIDLVYDLQVLGFKCREPEMDCTDPYSDSNCCKFQ